MKRKKKGLELEREKEERNWFMWREESMLLAYVKIVRSMRYSEKLAMEANEKLLTEVGECK